MIGERLLYGVAGVTFALYVVLGAPGVAWYDSGEFVAGVSSLGVTHPPGQPAYMVLARLAGLVPIGSLALRLTLLSAVCASFAAGGLAVFASRAAARMQGLPGGHVPLAGACAGLALGLSPALTLQAVRPELYSLVALLGVLAVLAVQSGGRRGVALAVVPLCVAGAVHHAILAAAVPGLALLALGRGTGSLKAALVATAALLPFGLGQFAWLPLRSLARPEVDFGVLRSFDRVVMAATGMGYSGSFRMEDGQLARNLREHLAVGVVDLGWVAVALAAGAGLWMLRRRPKQALVGVTFLLGGVMPTLLQGVFFPDNPDAHGYLLGPFAVVAAGAGVGAWLVVRALPRGGALPALLGAALLLGLVSGPLRGSLSLADRRGLHGPRRVAAELLHAATPGAVVLLGGDSWVMPALAARVHERRRPDVLVMGLQMVVPEALPDLAARSALPPSVAATWSPSTPLRAEHTVAALSVDLPVDLFVNDTYVPPPLLGAREPWGLLHRVHRASPGSGPGTPVTEAVLGRQLWEDLAAGDAWTRDVIGRDALTRRDLARGGFHRQRGDRELALRVLGRGSSTAPNPWDFVHLARHRLESGADAAGPSPIDPLADEAAAALLAGDLLGARERVDRVLAAQPTHPVGLLVAERLYTLGHHVSTQVSEP